MRKTPTNSANITGFQNEDVFAMLTKVLRRKGYLTDTQKKLVAKVPPIFAAGNTIKADFYFEGKPVAPNGFAISAKYQESGGSADEKVYYEVLYVIKLCLPVPSILLVRGDHWLSDPRQRARDWLKEQVDNKRLREVFFTVDDLLKWASNLPECTGFNFHNGHAKPLPLPTMEQKELL